MKTKRAVAVALSVLFSVSAVVGFGGVFAAKPVLATNPQVVVRFDCDVFSSTVGPLDGSVGAPPWSLSTHCPQAIANLLDTGFNQASAEESSFIFFGGESYTLIAAAGVKASKPAHDVLRLVCEGSALVFHDGSAGAPPVTATTCSQALADAVNHQFNKLASTEGLALAVATAYTLVRTHDN